FEINDAAQLVTDAAHPDANIIFGAVIDDALGDEVRVTVIAAGFDGGMPKPSPGTVATSSTLRPTVSARSPRVVVFDDVDTPQSAPNFG
ncbi:MAG TPA: cell division protein FtsZ, partial [Streptosporangiaceae bacterium]